jgi:F0F1-type ATP synthase membrane subunit b/b'
MGLPLTKGDFMKTIWEFITFILLAAILGYMFAVALLGV